MTVEQSTLNQQAPATQENPAPTPTEAVNSGSHPSATVTQEEINKLIGKARTEGKAAAVADLLKSLGVASAEELKALKDKATALEQANMTESQKLQAERDAAVKAKTDLEQRIATMEAERRNDKIASVITQAAQAMKANDADDVLTHARDKHKEELAALMDDKGDIDKKKVEALMEVIKKNKPHYFTPPASVPGSRSNNEGRVVVSDAEAMKRFSMNNQRAIRGR